ncbi:SDR family NAD(P)-dependent oxidoreductase [Amnibacterium endophyticum]|uniref:SDR family NAD(P)-dependent oxidoreductase n=1 Tax=Amnibacterium endophyticum TaxID=2109337 RepID=A0ABW4LAJ4_9MICO
MTFPHDRTAVVTGAGSPRGIGRATAQRLAADGWSVAVVDLDGAAAETVADELRAGAGVEAIGVAADVADPGQVDAAMRAVEAALPPVVGLVNLAGIGSPKPFLEETVEGWDRVMAVNLRSVFVVAQRVVPGMIERGLGRIVSASSISAQRGGGTYSKSAYSASKAGILGLTRALAREVGEHGITVNAIAPGPIDTDIMGGTLTPERKAALAVGTLVGRVGTPEEIAALIAFLLGPDAGYITGATVDVNGGLQIS